MEPLHSQVVSRSIRTMPGVLELSFWLSSTEIRCGTKMVKLQPTTRYCLDQAVYGKLGGRLVG